MFKITILNCFSSYYLIFTYLYSIKVIKKNTFWEKIVQEKIKDLLGEKCLEEALLPPEGLVVFLNLQLNVVILLQKMTVLVN